MQLVQSKGVAWQMHLDLHETTDTDETEFRPAKAARDGEANEPGPPPAGRPRRAGRKEEGAYTSRAHRSAEAKPGRRFPTSRRP